MVSGERERASERGEETRKRRGRIQRIDQMMRNCGEYLHKHKLEERLWLLAKFRCRVFVVITAVEGTSAHGSLAVVVVVVLANNKWLHRG